MARTKKFEASLAVFLALGFAVSIWYVSNPLIGTEEEIEGWLLDMAPMGSSAESVLGLVERRGWTLQTTWEGEQEEVDPDHFPHVAGNKIFHVYLGWYLGFPWRVDVDVLWGFDDHDRLIDIHVRKMTDSV